METLIYCFIFVIVSITIAKLMSLKNEKEIFLASILALIQLFILGFVLVFIINLKTLGIILMFLVMNLAGVIMVYRKIKLKNRVKFFLSLLITFFSTSSIILSLLLLTKVITPKPIEVIPLMGMVVGNCLNTIHLCLDKLQDMVKKDKDQIFGMLALGATEWIAIKYSLVNAIRSSIIPILNRTKSVGIIFIPGAMVGLLIAGANPIYAAKIQVVIMWMILSSSLISTSIISILIYKEFLKF